MLKDRINIKGYVKYKDDPEVEIFYDADRFQISRIGREFLQKLIDCHRDILNEESKSSSGFMVSLEKKKPILYRFEISSYENGDLTSFKNKAYIRKDTSTEWFGTLFEWVLLSRQTKTYKKKSNIIV